MTERTPEQQAVMQEILDEGAPGVAELVTLTDADLLALDGPDERGVAPLLWLGDFDVEHRRFAAEVAGRQLRARGLQTVIASEPSPAARRLAAVLDLRRTAGAFLIGEQEAAGNRHSLVTYLHRGDRAIVEETSHDGLHRFISTSAATALEGTVEWMGPVEGNDGAPRDYSVEEFTAQGPEILAATHRVSVLVGLRNRGGHKDERRTTIYTLPDRTVAVLPAGPQVLRMVEVSRRTLGGLVRSLTAD